MPATRLDLIARYLRPHRDAVICGGAALVAVNLFGVLIPLRVRTAIDDLQGGFQLEDLFVQAAVIVGLTTIMGAVRLWSRMLVFGAGRDVEVTLRQRIFDHMLRQDPGWVQRLGSGEVISRSTSDVENVRRLLGFAVLSLTNTLLAYAFTLPAMLAIDPWLTLAAVAVYPVMLATVGRFGGRMMRQQRQQQESLAGLSSLIQEDLTGIGAIKIYGQEPTEQEAFAQRNARYRDAALSLARTRSILFPLLEGLSSVSLLLLLALGSGQLESGRLSVGALVALILYVERLVFPTALLGFTLNTFQTGQVSLERVEQLLARQPTIQSPPQPIAPAPDSPGCLQARGLTVSYGKEGKPALEAISFDLHPGELVSVVGPVGCGKTTLVRALGLMVPVPSGQLFLDGIDVTAMDLGDLRRHVAMVPQEGYLFTSTLADNIRYGEPQAARQRVEAVAEQARLAGDIRGFPKGFETLVGERGITLSGGQRQRTALSRALLLDAPILVLDDALASVDNATAAAILEELRQNHRQTILLISHQLSAAAGCDRILVMESGHIVQQGRHGDLVDQPGTYRRLWERQQAEERLRTVVRA